MHYHPDDISRLFLGVPTLQLNRPAPAERFLAAAVATGAELRQVLRDYPQVRYQPLDFHYLCQQSLSALDDALLADLTRDMPRPPMRNRRPAVAAGRSCSCVRNWPSCRGWSSG